MTVAELGTGGPLDGDSQADRESGSLYRPQDRYKKQCPTCGAPAHEWCVTITGQRAYQPHVARWVPAGKYRVRRVYAPYRRKTER